MASIIRIKRSSVSGNPTTLAAGELAYSALADNGSNGGDRLYIGMGTETGGNAANHFVIGGKYFTDMLDHTPGVLTNSSALVVDASGKIDDFKVDNLQLNGNDITSTNTNGNINITPNGSGYIVLDGQTWPNAIGSNGSFLKTDGSGNLSWAAVPSGSFTISADTGTADTFTTGETLNFAGGTGIDTVVSNNQISIAIDGTVATSSAKLSFFAATTSAELASVISDETGSGLLVFATSPTLTTPNIGAATATSITGSAGNFTISAAAGNNNIVLAPTGTGTVDVSSKRIVSVAAPVDPTDAANKAYVDNSVSGLVWKQSVNLLATTNVALTGSTSTLVIDGHSALDSADNNIYRLLLTGQSTTSENGIYLYTDNGTTYALVRSTDADTYQELVGASVFVVEGTAYANTGWVQSNHYLSSFSGQTWVQFSGAGAYVAGNGLTLTGTTFDVGQGDGISVSANAIAVASTIAGNGLTYSTGVINVGGTADRITINADSIDIASTYAGQNTIATVGTITSGIWNGTAIGATHGGTGQTGYATGDLLYASATNTLSKLAAGADGKVLQINASGVPVWGDIDGGTY